MVILIFSIVINLILIGYIGYSKKGVLQGIKKKISNFSKNEDTVENSQLQAMNNVFIPPFVDKCNNKTGEKFKILVIGNSLAMHGIAQNIGWNHISGMAATSIEKDYAHLLFKKVENKLPKKKLCLRISNFAKFERNHASFESNSIVSLVNYQADLIVFQLGENVKIQNEKHKWLFEEKYIDLINSFRENGNPMIICTTPFFPSLIKNEIIEKVAYSTNSYLVDLSHLPLLNSNNYAKNETNYNGDKSIWKENGIGNHPGDIGMENIAKQIFITINASISDKKKNPIIE